MYITVWLQYITVITEIHFVICNIVDTIALLINDTVIEHWLDGIPVINKANLLAGKIINPGTLFLIT